MHRKYSKQFKQSIRDRKPREKPESLYFNRAVGVCFFFKDIKKDMTFQTTPTGYEKTILSDLQGAWENFRQSVLDSEGFEYADKVLFHTYEAMSWEVVRDLKRMPPLVLSIRNLCIQGNAPEDVFVWLNEINDTLTEVLDVCS